MWTISLLITIRWQNTWNTLPLCSKARKSSTTSTSILLSHTRAIHTGRQEMIPRGRSCQFGRASLIGMRRFTLKATATKILRYSWLKYPTNSSVSWPLLRITEAITQQTTKLTSAMTTSSLEILNSGTMRLYTSMAFMSGSSISLTILPSQTSIIMAFSLISSVKAWMTRCYLLSPRLNCLWVDREYMVKLQCFNQRYLNTWRKLT